MERMKMEKIKGLVSALFTPLDSSGNVRLGELSQIIEDSISAGIAGFYVLGSTGEGISMTIDERMAVAEAVVKNVKGRLPVMIQIGHNSIEESKVLAKHAKAIGATAISANAPSYFKISDVDILIDCMAEISNVVDLPFYYYHMPALTGAKIDMLEFLKKAPQKVSNLVGIKFSEMDPGKFLQCKRFADGKFDVLWGCDEHLLAALAVGAEGAVGSTYNFIPRLYMEIIKNHQLGKNEEAQSLMLRAYNYVELLQKHGPIHPCMKAVLRMLGYQVGNHRLPQPILAGERVEALREELESTGFFEWTIKAPERVVESAVL